MGNFSYYGIKTIIFQKIKEFFSEFQYTIIAPLISTFIFVLIMSTISNYYSIIIEEDNYLEFIVPGIVMMIVMQASYQNISESLIFMKQIGSFNDYLMSPISRLEILISFIIASIFIGVFIGLINIFFLNIFVKFDFINYYKIIYYLIIASLIFSSLGSIVGFLFYTWDLQQSVYNFIVIPISFLSGTFFSINSVNLKWILLFKINPFYQLVNNFRHSFKNEQSINFNVEIQILFVSFIILFISIIVFKKGYKVVS